MVQVEDKDENMFEEGTEEEYEEQVENLMGKMMKQV